ASRRPPLTLLRTGHRQAPQGADIHSGSRYGSRSQLPLKTALGQKWALPDNAASNAREMPSTVWVLVREVIEHDSLKAKHERLLKKSSKDV
ncbi:hypothetical protein, partial [Massilia genomosp. 1]|uniref:hypothetical protein n=1 Tax=Massilia genomosp. 1 TaxID=2609280 RepID=UPI0035A3760E